MKREKALWGLGFVNLILVVAVIVFLATGGHTGAASSGDVYAPVEKHILYIGTNDPQTYQPVMTPEAARAVVDAICVAHVDGFTVSMANGGWKDDAGALTLENTLVYTLYGAEDAQVQAIMDEVLLALNQSAILVEKGEAQTRMYSGNRE